MFVTKGKKLVEMDRGELDERISGYDKVTLDIGAGSGKFVYRLARENPAVFFIGLETSHESLLDYARRIERKPSRGGLPNVLYVVGSIDSPPDELQGIADEVLFNYPWTRLLKALVEGEGSMLKRVSALFRGEGVLTMTLCYDEHYEPNFVEEYGLPKVTEEYVREVMGPAYALEGFRFDSVEVLSSEEMRKEISEWGKRIAYARERTAWRIRMLRKY